MKKIILTLMFVGGMLAASENLNAFTAVTSGAWSSAATWGGIGPGSTVTNQDIIVPSGITVDLDVDVVFNGLANSFWVTGTLMSSNNSSVQLVDGTLTGTGVIDIHRLNLTSASAVYSFTGTLMLDVLRDAGTVVNLSSLVVIYDTLDLEQGSVVISSGGTLQLMGNSNVRVNNAILLINGGILSTGAPYDVWYYGTTKFAGEELNSAWVRDVHVLLDSNGQSLFLTGNTTVNGELDMTAGEVVLNGERLRLMGDLNRNNGALLESAGASDLVIAGNLELSSTLEFTSSSSLDELIIDCDNHSVHLANELIITGRLTLNEGMFVIDPLANLTMGTGSWITRVQGEIVQNGTFTATLQYNVEYTGDSCTTGAELSGSGLNDLIIEGWNVNSIITLNQNVTVPGNFMLTMGRLALGPFALTLEGSFYQTGNTMIRGTSWSDITFSMSTSVDDTLFMEIGTGLDDLILEIPETSVLHLGRWNLVMFGELTFVTGKLDAGNMDVYILSTGDIVGADDTSYVITSGTGGLHRYLQTGWSVYSEYPIGTATQYAPVGMKQNFGSPTGHVKARVFDGVWTNGDVGFDDALTQSVVNKTWFVEGDSGLPLNIDVRTGWIAACEVNGFDRQNCHIKNYYNNVWDTQISAAAAPGSYNTYVTSRLLIPNGGFFAVVDNNSSLSVPEMPVTSVSIFPNPTSDFVFTEVPANSADMYTYEVFDATGRLVNSFQSAESRNQIDFRTYELGAYTIRITNVATNEVVNKPIIKS
jgi:hypothetical protein